jgi:hypothetical protein
MRKHTRRSVALAAGRILLALCTHGQHGGIDAAVDHAERVHHDGAVVAATVVQVRSEHRLYVSQERK